MSAAVVVLPMVWATSSERKTGLQRRVDAEVLEAERDAGLDEELGRERRQVKGVAFYRRHTEGVLRRYVRMSMEAGKVPSLLGQDLFRSKISHYAIEGFDDVVIFVQDVEKCLAKLDAEQRLLVERIALQEYTQQETAEMMGQSLRSVHRRYLDALDVLTEIFLERKILEPSKICQEG